jgi:hypothetical protein
MKAVIVFAGSRPLLILTSYPSIEDTRFAAKLQAKRLRKFLAWEVGIERCRELYGYGFRDIVADLQKEDDLRVLDFDGQRVFLNFSLAELRQPFVFEPQGPTASGKEAATAAGHNSPRQSAGPQPSIEPRERGGEPL